VQPVSRRPVERVDARYGLRARAGGRIRPPASVDRVSDASPAGHLLECCGCLECWDIPHPPGDLRCLGHQEARRGALLIVASDDRGRHVARPRAIRVIGAMTKRFGRRRGPRKYAV
jgi:hypothetical protein